MPQVCADRFDEDRRPRYPYHRLSGDSVTPLATFGVLRGTMLIWNVLIWTVTFRQRISMTLWVAILGIFVGCTLNQIPALGGSRFNYGSLSVSVNLHECCERSCQRVCPEEARCPRHQHSEHHPLQSLCQVPALVGSRFSYGIFERGCLPS